MNLKKIKDAVANDRLVISTLFQKLTDSTRITDSVKCLEAFAEDYNISPRDILKEFNKYAPADLKTELAEHIKKVWDFEDFDFGAAVADFEDDDINSVFHELNQALSSDQKGDFIEHLKKVWDLK